MKKPKAILFDWDNTLANTWPIIYRALHDTFTEFGKEPWSLEETKQKVHRSMRDAFPDLFGKDWERAGESYQRYYRQYQLDTLEPLPQADTMLEYLKPLGLFMGVVSNKKGENLRREVEHLGWGHYFSAVVGADDAATDKPTPAPIHLALKKSGLPLNEDVWLVGDTVTDMECAHNSGILPIFYGDDDPTGERYKHCPPVTHVKHHAELIALLKKL